VNAASHYLHESDAMEALFGKEQILFPSFKMERLHDGALVGPDGPKNTRVSGVLLVSALTPWSTAARRPVTYHNPWAQRPLLAAFDPLAKSIPGAEDTMELVEGVAIHKVFELDKGWPL
jgi:hypothetical protein